MQGNKKNLIFDITKKLINNTLKTVTMKNLPNVFDAFLGGSAKFVRLSMKTDVSKKMNAAARKSIGQGENIYCVKTVLASANWNYGKVVNSRQEKEGQEPTFSPLPSWGTAYGEKGSALFYKTSDPTKWYFRYYNAQILEAQYYIGDRQATAQEVSQIKAAVYKRKDTGRQGLSMENHVKVRMVKFSNLTEVYYKETKWDLTIPENVLEEVSQTV